MLSLLYRHLSVLSSNPVHFPLIPPYFDVSPCVSIPLYSPKTLFLFPCFIFLLLFSSFTFPPLFTFSFSLLFNIFISVSPFYFNKFIFLHLSFCFLILLPLSSFLLARYFSPTFLVQCKNGCTCQNKL